MKKLSELLILSSLWSVIFLPNGQYVVVQDAQTDSAVVSPTGGGSYKTTHSDGSTDTMVPTGRNSYYQNSIPSYQPSTYQAPAYQAQSNTPDFRVKPYNYSYGQ